MYGLVQFMDHYLLEWGTAKGEVTRLACLQDSCNQSLETWLLGQMGEGMGTCVPGAR